MHTWNHLWISHIHLHLLSVFVVLSVASCFHSPSLSFVVQVGWFWLWPQPAAFPCPPNVHRKQPLHIHEITSENHTFNPYTLNVCISASFSRIWVFFWWSWASLCWSWVSLCWSWVSLCWSWTAICLSCTSLSWSWPFLISTSASSLPLFS